MTFNRDCKSSLCEVIEITAIFNDFTERRFTVSIARKQ